MNMYASTYALLYKDSRRADPIHGIALPIFIHNGTYFLETLDIYEDGVVECWEIVRIDDLEDKVMQDWVASEPPIGARVSFHELGSLRLTEAIWNFPRGEIVTRAQALFHHLNPERKALLDLVARYQEVAAEEQIDVKQLSLWRPHSDANSYRIGADGAAILGNESLVFSQKDGTFVLTKCFAYQDQRAQIGVEGDLIPLDSLQQQLESGILTTSLPEDVWITIPGLGRLRGEDASWYIDPLERWREIVDQAGVLNGQTDAVEICYRAFLAHQENPTAANLEILRAAYLRVPEHQRRFTQRSMDDKDHNIRRLLNM
jgi:hypothetical protein